MNELKIKWGFDPTGKDLHLGRCVQLFRLKTLQEEGHKIVLIIGDFTALIGDPSDKLGKRPRLSKKEIEQNIKSVLPKIGNILDLNKCEVLRNSRWLSRLTAKKLMELTNFFTFQQILERKNFKERLIREDPIFYGEGMYPIFQGYDSYQVGADVEIGGEDQLFNMNMGRDIQGHYGMKPQRVVTFPLLLAGNGRKMSTTEGNVINTDDPDMFDKIVSIRDDLIEDYTRGLIYDEDCAGYILREIKEGRCKGEAAKNLKIALANMVIKKLRGGWYLEEISEAEYRKAVRKLELSKK